MSKTSIQFKHADNIWPIVEKWANENGYEQESASGSMRLYFRETPETSGRISLEIAQVDADVIIRAWYSDVVRNEMAIDSASLYSALPRIEAHSEIKTLSTALGYRSAGKTKSKKKKNIAFNFGRSIRKLSGKNSTIFI